MNKPFVLIYGAEWCIHCTRAKNWLEKNEVNFEFKNVEEESNQQELQEFNADRIPYFRIIKENNGENIGILGFRPEKLKEALK